MIARTIAIAILLIFLFWCSSLDFLFSAEELEKMGVNSNNLEFISKGDDQILIVVK